MEAEQPDDDFEECVPLSAYLEMTARLLGRIHALEATLAAVLAERKDLPRLSRHADAILLNDEASRIATNRTEEETIKTHEYARQSADALFANARIARRIK